MADELEDVKVHLNRLRFVSVDWPRGADKITGEHEAILAALRARDEERAAAAMTATCAPCFLCSTASLAGRTDRLS